MVIVPKWAQPVIIASRSASSKAKLQIDTYDSTLLKTSHAMLFKGLYSQPSPLSVNFFILRGAHMARNQVARTSLSLLRFFKYNLSMFGRTFGGGLSHSCCKFIISHKNDAVRATGHTAKILFAFLS